MVRASAETLAPFMGRWVATKGRDVLIADDDPYTVVDWLREHQIQADSMFRVPLDDGSTDPRVGVPARRSNPS
jgi:hypothetical protein